MRTAILLALREKPLSCTRIFQKANVTFRIVKESLQFFEKNGFVMSFSPSTIVLYRLTRKGRKILDESSRLCEILLGEKNEKTKFLPRK